MPKRPRQSHVPRQAATRKRKATRRPLYSPEELYAPNPVVEEPPPAAPERQRAVVGQRRRQLSGDQSYAVRAGQLPTFERGYLVDELRRIGITAAGLMALIIVLTVLLR